MRMYFTIKRSTSKINLTLKFAKIQEISHSNLFLRNGLRRSGLFWTSFDTIRRKYPNSISTSPNNIHKINIELPDANYSFNDAMNKYPIHSYEMKSTRAQST